LHIGDFVYWRLCILAALHIGGLHIERARLA
jgi:hypothetical protein